MAVFRGRRTGSSGRAQSPSSPRRLAWSVAGTAAQVRSVLGTLFATNQWETLIVNDFRLRRAKQNLTDIKLCLPQNVLYNFLPLITSSVFSGFLFLRSSGCFLGFIIFPQIQCFPVPMFCCRTKCRGLLGPNRPFSKVRAIACTL